jgi:hypothetical protein
MTVGARLSAWAQHPSVLMVVLGLALFPFVREERPLRVLRLTPEQTERALDRERRRSDAPETLASQARAREEALDEEALAEFAIAEELHRRDDGLRLALAQAARRELSRATPAPTPTDAELHALASEVPLEALVDAKVVREGGRVEEVRATTLHELEQRLAVRHLPLPADDARTVRAETPTGERLVLTIARSTESDAERFERLRPELERRFAQEHLAARAREAVRALRATYDRAETP